MADSDSDNTSGSSSSEKVLPGTYTVEKILDQRVVRGQLLYFIKWKGYSHAENTWEPEEHLTGCRGLINEFKKKLENEDIKIGKTGNKKTTRPRRKAVNRQAPGSTEAQNTNNDGGLEESSPIDRMSTETIKLTGFDRGLQPKEILGASDCAGELMHLIKWKGTDEPEMVPARISNKKCPQLVIAFYETIVTWADLSDTD